MQNFKKIIFLITVCLFNWLSYATDFNRSIDKDLIKWSKYGKPKKVTEFLDAGADIKAVDIYGNSALINATMFRRIDVIGLLFANGAPIDTGNLDGDTPLIVAVRNRYPEVVEMLLEYGADPHKFNNSGENAFMIASNRGYDEILSALRKPLLLSWLGICLSRDS